jgi:hypothetical protein
VLGSFADGDLGNSQACSVTPVTGHIRWGDQERE